MDTREPRTIELEARVRELSRKLGTHELEHAAALREIERLEGELGGAGERVAAADAARARQARQIDTLRGQLDAADLKRQRVVGDYSQRIRALEQRVSMLTSTLREVRADVERAAESRAWRLGHGVTKTAARAMLRPPRTEGALARALTRIDRLDPAAEVQGTEGSGGEAPAAVPRPEAPAEDDPASEQPEDERRYRAALAHEIRLRLGSVRELDRWPAVSVVVVNRDGQSHLERLLDGLSQHTDYPALDLVVVDNDSADGSRALLEAARPGFGLRVIAGERELSFSEANWRGAQAAEGELLLLLNNDVEPFEAGWLKELVAALHGADCAAVGATLLHPGTGSSAEPRPLVQHRAIRFGLDGGVLRARNDRDGEVLWDCDFGIEVRAPAVTAACMLLRAEEFERAGGFDRLYRYGGEDVDLGLRLHGGDGSVLASGRAVLVHRESATRLRQDGDVRHVDRGHNRRTLLERWGPRIRREYRLSRLHRSPLWTDGRGPRAMITVTSARQEDGWGDWVTAHELGEALETLGWRVGYGQRADDEWYELPGDLDYVISLLDGFDLGRVPDGVTAVAWIRNWTERWLERPWLDRADLILASSRRSAELIEERTGRRATLFPLAANPARFKPGISQPVLAADYIFTGNRWGEERAIQRALRPRKGESFKVFGNGWERVKPFSRATAGRLPYEELPAAYASTKLVIDDTQSPTLPYGAVNGRVFESLAAGTLALTNCEAGAAELFGDDYPVWSTSETLRSELDRLLADDALRDSLAQRFRAQVLREHTYAHRAYRLRTLLVEHEQLKSFCLKIGAPNREVAHTWGDLHFAEAFARELRRRGHRTRIETLDEWESEEGLSYDIVIHLRGRSRYHVKPGQSNILWSISHPGELTGEECDAYDLVFVCSEKFALELRERTRTPVEVLEQATDPRVFYPDPDPAYAHDLVYVANSRGVLRPIVRDLLPTDHDLAIWGANWEGLIDTRHVVADHIPNDQLRKVYSSAKIVLCDHWDDMREHGYISNRVFDALACGAFVVCDDVAGLEGRFGDSVAVYRDDEDVKAIVQRRLSADANESSNPRAIALVHSFVDRADRLLNQSLATYRLRLRSRRSDEH